MDGVEKIRATLSAGYEQNHPFRVQRHSDRGSQHSKRDREQQDSADTATHEDRVELHDDDSLGERLPKEVEPTPESRTDQEPEFHLDIAV